MSIKKFGFRDSRSGSQSYTAWTESYGLCDGHLHLRVSVSEGAWAMRGPSVIETGPCAQDECATGTLIDESLLVAGAQKKFGILEEVPDGCILVQYIWNDGHQVGFYWVFKSGDKYPPGIIREGKAWLLAPGETTPSTLPSRRDEVEDFISVMNSNGEAEEIFNKVR